MNPATRAPGDASPAGVGSAAEERARFALRRWPAAGPGGESARAALLVVHGLSEHAGRYAGLAAAAGARGMATAAVDLYGHGESPGRRGHIRDFDGDHLAAVDELVRRVEKEAPDLPLVLVGHSMGGLVAARWAQRRVFARRLRGLVLIAPFVKPRLRIPRWKRAAARLLSRAAPAVALPTGIDDEDLIRDPAERQRYAADPLVQHRISAGHWRALGRERERLRIDAPATSVPTLFLLAGEDRIVDTAAARELAGRMPAATTVEYPDAYHDLLHDPVAARVFDDLLSWVERRVDAA